MMDATPTKPASVFSFLRSLLNGINSSLLYRESSSQTLMSIAMPYWMMLVFYISICRHSSIGIEQKWSTHSWGFFSFHCISRVFEYWISSTSNTQYVVDHFSPCENLSRCKSLCSKHLVVQSENHGWMGAAHLKYVHIVMMKFENFDFLLTLREIAKASPFLPISDFFFSLQNSWSKVTKKKFVLLTPPLNTVMQPTSQIWALYLNHHPNS